MLLANLDDIQPGMQVGASVMSPEAADMVLLKPGVALTNDMISRLRRLGVTQVWVDHALTRDLDAALAPSLAQARLAVFKQLKDNISQLAHKTISTAQLRDYRNAVTDLVREALVNKDYISLTEQLFDAQRQLVSHSTNVAFLCVLVGLELEGYLVRERTRLPAWRARNVINLGLGGLLHDIGKVRQDSAMTRCHDIFDPDGEHLPPEYVNHPAAGYDLLPPSVPAVTRNAVLCHHLRFDGTGWSTVRGGAGVGHSGRRIHIFSRIVSAANALDNLLHDPQGERRPPVAALHDFASARYDGWFDPVVRLAVLKRVPPFAVGTQVTLSDGRAAVVTQPNPDEPCRPVVRMLETLEKGQDPDATMHVDLTARRDLRISSAAGVNVERWLFDVNKNTIAMGRRRDDLSDVA